MDQGEVEDAGDWQGVEPDQGADDAYFERQRVVVEAAAELSVVLFVAEELRGQALGLPWDDELAGQAAGDRPADGGADSAAAGGVGGEPEIDVFLRGTGAAHCAGHHDANRRGWAIHLRDRRRSIRHHADLSRWGSMIQ